MSDKQKTNLTILRAAPRGFCAGVDRAIQIVERALIKYGAPVYVRHEIVHNARVVGELRDKGAVFVEELSDIPDNHKSRPVVFSAHGVAKVVIKEADDDNLHAIDATCPLVTKVHKEAIRHHKNGLHIILIGHAGHPEVIGTMGQLPSNAVTLIETVDDVTALNCDKPLAYVTQTTLSVDDTADIVNALKSKFVHITGPAHEDICYATTNRQEAVKIIAPQCDLVLVLGAPNSSNSNRLVEVAKAYGCAHAFLIQTAVDIDLSWFENVKTLGLTAGASAPESLVNEVIENLRNNFNIDTQDTVLKEENILFNVPRDLRDVS